MPFVTNRTELLDGHVVDHVASDEDKDHWIADDAALSRVCIQRIVAEISQEASCSQTEAKL